MTEDEVRVIVDRAIRAHEVRVAVVSGVMGLALLGGFWHAVLLLRCWVRG